jgi:ABC-type branched-subunit amino acid transport system ATPase component
LEPLVISDLHAFYGKAHVLQGVTLTAAAGAVTGLLGRNGAGKTTLLRSVMRLGPRTQGDVLLFGRPTAGMRADAIARAGVAYMPQGLRVFPRLSVRENLLVAAHASPSPRPIDEVLRILPTLEPLLHRRAGTLSGGQQQMVGLGRSLAMRCRVLLMDEPTEGLMPQLVSQVGEIVRRIAAEGTAVLLVEQNVQLVLNTCDRAYIMEKGRIKADGATRDLPSRGVLDRYLGLSVR